MLLLKRRFARSVRPLLLTGALAAMACGGSPTTPSSSSTTSTSTSTSTSTLRTTTTTANSTIATTIASTTTTSSLTFTVSDGCNDGRGLQVKFFDETNNLVWPDASQVYLVGVGGSINPTLACRTGAKICYGARTDPQTSSYWGVDVTNSQGCDNCCYTCQTTSVSVRLTC